MTLQNLKQIIVPSPLQILVCCFLALLLIGLSYGDLLVGELAGSAGVSSEILRQSLLSSLAQISSLTFGAKIAVAATWMIIAALIYALGLTMTNALIDLRNTIVINTSFVHRDSPLHVAQLAANKVLIALVLCAFLVLAGVIIIPNLVQIAGPFLLAGVSIPSAIAILEAVAGLAVTFYVIWTLLQIVFVAL